MADEKMITIDNLGGWSLEGEQVPHDLLIAIGKVVKLTESQYEAWVLVVGGLSVCAAARELGISRAACRERLQGASVKLCGGVSQEFFGKNFGLYKALAEDWSHHSKHRPTNHGGSGWKIVQLSQDGAGRGTMEIGG